MLKNSYYLAKLFQNNRFLKKIYVLSFCILFIIFQKFKSNGSFVNAIVFSIKETIILRNTKYDCYFSPFKNN